MTNEQLKQPVTVLGLGFMGTALADAFRRAGHPTTVWTRSNRPGPDGTTAATSAAAAVAASPLVVACVLDYGAVDDVLVGDLAGKTIVNLTTGTPEQAREFAARIAARGARYLDGGIMTEPSGIGDPTSMILFSGSADAYEAHREAFEVLGDARFLGADAGLAALYDTALLGIMYSAMTGYLQATALVGREEVSAVRFTPLAQELLGATAAFLGPIAEQVDSGDHTSRSARLDMQLSAADHLIHAGQVRGVDTTVLEHVKSLMERAVADGHGGSDFGAVIEQLRTV
ncbi:NAD(P)-binding domain-containing protein [Actinosynnema sp. NPDC047251]|uniref:Dehydrogenase n=1 Tax=Saccharothrix espanaensis (strain ATCC 51144 / DSM 44229 / JCM 9112 / NBRC 15066 / NRRL 15764) TaxID=1179773 RepID=K0JTI2_SACES|nr:NAD(P)-binding domain-containing protein [Saccharothrix espanaensis]CCH28857.1 Dehydrogenase [Saccharothrix espanaensis DSM 44229]